MADLPPRRRRPGRPAGWTWPVLLLAALGAALPRSGAAGTSPLRIVLNSERVKQGGIATLQIEGAGPLRKVRARAAERELAVAHGRDPSRALAWIGLDLAQPPGPVAIRVEAEDEAGRLLRAETVLVAVDAHFPTQRLTLPRPFVELDAATLERVAREKAALDRLWGTWTPAPLWHAPFRLPLDGDVAARGFGLQRVINGEPRAPHTGVDLPAAAGTPVLAANDGIVVVAEQQFFAGKIVILDHGMGLFTMYFHLQDILVRPGQHVERGDLIARVGSTGRATGPHLHWGARLQGARVDPMDLVHLRPLD